MSVFCPVLGSLGSTCWSGGVAEDQYSSSTRHVMDIALDPAVCSVEVYCFLLRSRPRPLVTQIMGPLGGTGMMEWRRQGVSRLFPGFGLEKGLGETS